MKFSWLHDMVFLGDAAFCPECTSDHVIQLAGEASPSASTPIHYGFNQSHDTCFGFDYIDIQKVYVAIVTHFIN